MQKRHIPIIRKVYWQRRDIMLQALERYFPEGCSWTKLQGSLFFMGEPARRAGYR